MHRLIGLPRFDCVLYKADLLNEISFPKIWRHFFSYSNFNYQNNDIGAMPICDVFSKLWQSTLRNFCGKLGYIYSP